MSTRTEHMRYTRVLTLVWPVFDVNAFAMSVQYFFCFRLELTFRPLTDIWIRIQMNDLMFGKSTPVISNGNKVNHRVEA